MNQFAKDKRLTEAMDDQYAKFIAELLASESPMLEKLYEYSVDHPTRTITEVLKFFYFLYHGYSNPGTMKSGKSK